MNTNMLSQKEIQNLINLSKETTEGITNLKEKMKKRAAIDMAKEILKEIDPEDFEMMEENKKAREFYSAEGVNNLYKAICYNAVRDFKSARKFIGSGHYGKKGYEKETRDCDTILAETERFFDSKFFMHNTGCYNKKRTIKLIEQQMKKEAVMKIVR